MNLEKSMKQYFKVSKSHANSFLHPGHQKKRLGRSCLSDVLSWRMSLVDVLKNEFGEVDEALFQGV
jgi:hypothetical protein